MSGGPPPSLRLGGPPPSLRLGGPPPSLRLGGPPLSLRLGRVSSANGTRRNSSGASTPIDPLATPNGRINRGLLLAVNPNANANFDPFALSEGKMIERAGDEVSIFFIKGANGRRIGVRKVVKITNGREGQFEATKKEASVYERLTKLPDWRDHLIPYISSKKSRATVMIDFDYIEGSDVLRYIHVHPEEARELLKKVAQQLKWLAENGYSHGDIKLDNFFRTTDGRVLMLDLGTVARLDAGGARASARTDKAAFIFMVRDMLDVSSLDTRNILYDEPEKLPEFYEMVVKMIDG